jgi:glycosyltransferase involved in cell wall biosynthesis
VVPTRARPRGLATCLLALAEQRYASGLFHVVVVDDGGDSLVEADLASVRAKLDLEVVRLAHSGPAAARNAGAARARGELLVFTDDDCRPDPGWLAAFAARFEGAPERAFGGRTVNALPSNPYSTASQLLVSYLYDYYDAARGGAAFFTSNNLAVPARLFREMRGFDPSYPRAAAEDRDFCDRWRARGLDLVYAPEAVVHHAHALTLRGYARQHLDYGRGAAQLHRGRAANGRGPLRLEPPGFYLGLLRYPVGRARRRDAPLLAALLALSQVATAAGFTWESARRWRRS